MVIHPGLEYRNVPQPKNRFLGQPTPKIGEPGSHVESGYREEPNVPHQQPQFERQQFSQATDGYIDSEFGAYAGAELHNLVQPQRTSKPVNLGALMGMADTIQRNLKTGLRSQLSNPLKDTPTLES